MASTHRSSMTIGAGTASSGADPTVRGASQRSTTDTKGNPSEAPSATDMDTTPNKSGDTTLANLGTDGMTDE
jgi:hypothetical protein